MNFDNIIFMIFFISFILSIMFRLYRIMSISLEKKKFNPEIENNLWGISNIKITMIMFVFSIISITLIEGIFLNNLASLPTRSAYFYIALIKPLNILFFVIEIAIWLGFGHAVKINTMTNKKRYNAKTALRD